MEGWLIMSYVGGGVRFYASIVQISPRSVGVQI